MKHGSINTLLTVRIIVLFLYTRTTEHDERIGDWSTNVCSSDLRAPLTEAEVRPMIGLGARPMLEQGLAATGGVPDGALDRLYPDLLRYYDAPIAVHSSPFPGLPAAPDRPGALGISPAAAAHTADEQAPKDRTHARDGKGVVG